MRTIATIRALWGFIRAYARAMVHLPHPFGFALANSAIDLLNHEIAAIWSQERTQ